MQRNIQTKFQKTKNRRPLSETDSECLPSRTSGGSYRDDLDKDDVGGDQIEALLWHLDSTVLNANPTEQVLVEVANSVLQEMGRISLRLYRQQKLSAETFAAPVERMIQVKITNIECSNGEQHAVSKPKYANSMWWRAPSTRSPGP